MGTPRERDPSVTARLGQVFGGQFPREPGRAVQDDVELALVRFSLACHACRRYPSVSGSSRSSPSTCLARNASTTWYQTLAFCGDSTQWFSEGK